MRPRSLPVPPAGARAPGASALLVGVLLAGVACGPTTGEPTVPSPAPEPSASSTPSPAPPSDVPDDPTDDPTGGSTGARPDGRVPHRTLAEVTGTNAGGSPSTGLVVLPDDAATATWLSQLTSGVLREDVRDAVDTGRADLGPDESLLGAVLSVGCESPRGWSVERVDGELRVRVRMPKQTVQCLVPETTVAVLAVDEDEARGVAGPA